MPIIHEKKNVNMIMGIFKSFCNKAYYWAAVNYNQVKTWLYSYVVPYTFDSTKYPNSFLVNEVPAITNEDHCLWHEKVPRVIYIFWTGDNEITPNRMAGINSLEKTCGVDVKLITPKKLDAYIKDDDPLPEAYQHLSLNHKSDYLRSYFMHHYGGGYADIKTYSHSWVDAFNRLDNSEAYAIGYPEVGFLGAAYQDVKDATLQKDLKTYWRLLIGNGAFVCRPHTPLTIEWHKEAKRRVMVYGDELKKHPARDIFGRNADYPLAWSMMQGAIFHPLCLKYRAKLLNDKSLMPSFKNYR